MPIAQPSMAGKRRRGLGLSGSLALLLLACGPVEPEHAPYGFDLEPEQPLHLEHEVRMEIDGERVEIERVGDFLLVGVPRSEGGIELRLHLKSYLERVRTGEGEPAELAIGPQGIVSSGAPLGERRLGPEEKLPSGLSLEQALRRPLAAAFLGGRGDERGARWRTLEPTLEPVRAMEWILLALPELPEDGAGEWSARRPMPRIGQYELGLELPLRHTRDASHPGEIRSDAVLERPALELVRGFAGQLLLDLEGLARFAPDGALQRAVLELRLRFDAQQGGRVTSVEKLRLRCARCPEA